MKIRRICSYRKFIKEGRPYYPFVQDGTLILPHFSTSPDSRAGHNKRVLCCNSAVVYNRAGFVAVYYEWYSRYGVRQRWFYFRDARRVTWHELSWDERRKVVSAIMKNSHSALDSYFFIKPSKTYDAIARSIRIVP